MALIAAHHWQVLAEAESSHPLPPTLAQDEAGHALALLGLVWDGDALADAKALLPDAVRTRGRSLEACAGEFVAIFAEPDGTLHVVNDRFASRPCYWIASHRVVSSHLAHALALAAKCERYLADYAAGRHASEEPFGTLATLCLAPEALA